MEKNFLTLKFTDETFSRPPSPPSSYVRHREAVVALLLLAHAALLRSASLPTLLQLLPPGAAGKLPWLVRATGAEALAIFPLGFKASAEAVGCSACQASRQLLSRGNLLGAYGLPAVLGARAGSPPAEHAVSAPLTCISLSPLAGPGQALRPACFGCTRTPHPPSWPLCCAAAAPPVCAAARRVRRACGLGAAIVLRQRQPRPGCVPAPQSVPHPLGAEACALGSQEGWAHGWAEAVLSGILRMRPVPRDSPQKRCTAPDSKPGSPLATASTRLPLCSHPAALPPATGCLRTMLQPTDVILPLLLSCALPALLLFKFEAHSRRRFLEAERRVLAQEAARA